MPIKEYDFAVSFPNKEGLTANGADEENLGHSAEPPEQSRAACPGALPSFPLLRHDRHILMTIRSAHNARRR